METTMAQLKKPPSHPSLIPTRVESPPKGWIESNRRVEITARILLLWETTFFLIRDEPVLGRDQQRFLAMIHDHKVSTMLKSTWNGD